MTAAKDIRRQRLLHLLDGPRFKGSRQKFQREAGLTSGRVSQLLDPRQPFGEMAAQHLTAALGLGPNYFDDASLSGPTMDIALRLEAIGSDVRLYREAYMRLMAALDDVGAPKPPTSEPDR